MPLALLTLLSGLLISGVAIYYSVAGLTSIFAAAVVPIIIMGTSLEIAKLVATVWLKQNWDIAPRILKAYLLLAVVVLMLITSMGIFGYLSKAHSDQNLVSGDVQAKVAVYDEKIKTAKDNIDADRRALQQMDSQVDQLLGRTTDDTGANRAVAVRNQQKRERTRLSNEIASNQELVAKLNDEAAPIRAQVRKVEAEVGPVKYIAALIYGDKASSDMLEKAVRWVIILIVVVFDPLAVTLLLASQYSFALAAEQRKKKKEDEFVESFLEAKGTVDPNINLDFDKPEPEPATPEIIEEPARPELTIEGNTVIDPEKLEPQIRIIHTEDSIIVEDSAGTQEIVPDPVPTVSPIGDDYVTIDGQVFHRKAVQPHLATYVQNEEQKESSKWSEILSPKPISEGEYLEQANQRQRKSDEQ